MCSDCCGPDFGKFSDQFDWSMKETEKGIQIDVTPKDMSKSDSLKSLFKGMKDFCKCG